MAATKSSGKSAGKTARLMSLDVFRGATVAFMIIVNTPGTWSHVYAPLRHAPWHGCTPTDLVFPSFLFISGVAMWFSLRKFNFEFSGASLFRILRRVLLIFAAGLFLNIFPHFIDRDYNTLRIMGVLQRIALAWGLGSSPGAADKAKLHLDSNSSDPVRILGPDVFHGRSRSLFTGG
ncbi:MAG: heparan-alpha-glucosaminide N-acetyltransferase domain-containing protein [Bacteroidales bacterium]